MPCSPEMLAANRRNASRSTGPKSIQGKSRSRRNALKHGLTGAGVAVPDEDSAAIEARFEAFEVDLKPEGAVAQFEVRRAAMLSVRLERCVRHESAELTRDMLRAGHAEADARAEEVARLVASLADDPAEGVRKLRRTLEGLDWMIAAWRGLKADIAPRPIERWRTAQFNLAEQLTGRKPEFLGTSRISALSQAIGGNPKLLADDDWPDLPPLDRRQAARGELASIIDSEVARLEAARAGLDREAIAREYAGAPARALFGTSKEAVLARKYEAAAEREFYRALKQVERLNARVEADDQNARVEADDQADSLDATHDETDGCPESGSFFPGPEVERRAASGGSKTAMTRAGAPSDRPRKDPGRPPEVGSRPFREPAGLEN